MKTKTLMLLLLLTQIPFTGAAFAQGDQNVLVPLPSVDDFTNGQNGWAFGLGLGVEYESAYEGSDEFGFEAQPAGAIQWRDDDDIYYFAGEAFGWRGVRDTQWLFDALVGFEEGREEGDSDEGYLNGLGSQEEGFELVFQVRRSFSSEWRYWLVSRIVASDEGNLGLFGFGRRFGDQLDGTGSEINVVLVVHDGDYANKGFGISAEQAESSGLQETRLSSGLRSFGVDYSFRHNYNKNWQIFGEVLFEYFGSDVRSSPIARSNFEAEIGVGAIFTF